MDAWELALEKQGPHCPGSLLASFPDLELRFTSSTLVSSFQKHLFDPCLEALPFLLQPMWNSRVDHFCVSPSPLLHFSLQHRTTRVSRSLDKFFFGAGGGKILTNLLLRGISCFASQKLYLRHCFLMWTHPVI